MPVRTSHICSFVLYKTFFTSFQTNFYFSFSPPPHVAIHVGRTYVSLSLHFLSYPIIHSPQQTITSLQITVVRLFSLSDQPLHFSFHPSLPFLHPAPIFLEPQTPMHYHGLSTHLYTLHSFSPSTQYATPYHILFSSSLQIFFRNPHLLFSFLGSFGLFISYCHLRSYQELIRNPLLVLLICSRQPTSPYSRLSLSIWLSNTFLFLFIFLLSSCQPTRSGSIYSYWQSSSRTHTGCNSI